MGRSHDKGGATFEMCSTLPAYGHMDYEHAFQFERMISPDTALMLSASAVKSTEMKGFAWAAGGLQDKFVKVKVPREISLTKDQTYVCLFDAADPSDIENNINLKSVLPYEEWGIPRIVQQTFKSWRLRFLGNRNLNTWYQTHGEQAFMMLDHHPDVVAKLLYLNKDKLLRLKNEVASLKGKWNHLKHLLKHNLTLQEAELVTDLLSAQVDETSKNDPFLLLTVRNLTKDFRHRYFNAMGVYEKCKTDLPAMIAGYLDTHLMKKGDTAMLLQDAIKEASDALQISKAVIECTIENMITNGQARLYVLNGENTVSMGKLLAADIAVAEGLAARDEDNNENPVWIESFPVNYTPDGRKITLNVEQQVLIQTVFATSTSVCTGGPGTGKSTVMKSLIRELRRVNPTGRIILAAPTGKAARRLTEVTGEPSQTLHKFMGMTPGSSPALDSFNETDTLILDEASMMDLHLLASALKQTGNRGRVIFSGDKDQLASIDTGAILHDMLMSRHIAVAELTEPQRQALLSDIVTASYAIRDGKMPTFPGPAGDFHFIEADTPEEINQRIQELCADIIPSTYGIPLKDIQILGAMRKGEAGINKLNESLKPIFNATSLDEDTQSRNLGSQTYHVGDRVMQLKNRYDLDVQNGEVGTIIAFDERKKAVIVEIEDRVIPLPFDNYPYMTHSWGMTVHKSQGSEYPCVIISLPDDHSYMLDRTIVFTGTTRAKQQGFVVGSKKTLQESISKIKTRMTHLPFLIAEKICERSQHQVFQNLAKDSKKVAIPKPIHRVRAMDIDVPF